MVWLTSFIIFFSKGQTGWVSFISAFLAFVILFIHQIVFCPVIWAHSLDAMNDEGQSHAMSWDEGEWVCNFLFLFDSHNEGVKVAWGWEGAWRSRPCARGRNECTPPHPPSQCLCLSPDVAASRHTPRTLPLVMRPRGSASRSLHKSRDSLFSPGNSTQTHVH